jgi:hypothetical protein
LVSQVSNTSLTMPSPQIAGKLIVALPCAPAVAQSAGLSDLQAVRSLGPESARSANVPPTLPVTGEVAVTWMVAIRTDDSAGTDIPDAVIVMITWFALPGSSAQLATCAALKVHDWKVSVPGSSVAHVDSVHARMTVVVPVSVADTNGVVGTSWLWLKIDTLMSKFSLSTNEPSVGEGSSSAEATTPVSARATPATSTAASAAAASTSPLPRRIQPTVSSLDFI